MTLPVVPGVVKARVIGNSNGVPWNNIWYLGYTGTPPDDVTCSNIAAAMYAPYVSAGSLLAHWNSQTQIEACEVEDLSSTSGGVGVHASTQSGAIVGDYPDAADSLLCKLFIARRYRGGHPRKYLPPLDPTYASDEQHWTLGILTGMATAMGTAFTSSVFIAFGSTSVTGLVNVSFYAGFTNYTKPSGRAAVRSNVRGTPLVDAVAGFELESLIATQRRRVGR